MAIGMKFKPPSHRGSWAGLVAVIAIGGMTLPAHPAAAAEPDRVEKTIDTVRGLNGHHAGYWIMVRERRFRWVPKTKFNVVAVYRGVTSWWIDNLKDKDLGQNRGGGGYYDDGSWNFFGQAEEIAARVDFNKLENAVKEVYKTQGTSHVMFLDQDTGELIGFDGIGDRFYKLDQWRNEGTSSVKLLDGREITMNLHAYVWEFSPIILDLGGVGRPDLLAGPSWKSAPGRKLATSALRQFDLDGTGKGTWEWVGPGSGLLAWDPHRHGEITNGTQLFGNITWGKKWRDGYEALATIDQNSDGCLKGPELDDLAVWVDRNANAVSDPGEVIPIRNLGIESLAVNAQRDKEGNAHASQGFERRVAGGKKKVYASWDWIALGKARPTDGTYVWIGKDRRREVGGVLRLRDDGGTIRGLSIPTIGVRRPPKGVLVAMPVSGQMHSGTAQWRLVTRDTVVTSQVEAIDEGKHLLGKTTVQERGGKPWSYEWQAELVRGEGIGSAARKNLNQGGLR